jgi:hypothetical protein
MSKFQEKYLDQDINCLKELLRHKVKVILEQARKFAELKQKLLQVEESYQRKREFARTKSDIAKADLLVSAFCNIKLSCKMNAKSVMSFGLKIVGFGAKRQNVQDTLNIQHFRPHFGIGPEAIIDIIANMTNGKRDTQVSKT